ncbi:MAG: transcriptional regulator [Deltaproteobacteria bacterium HGW-Deltaproteobacteria-11]|nr:MAG: transcriptional regulator [Deltaproteobacteria bacterium HGW-Deltaproteobacteria-11]
MGIVDQIAAIPLFEGLPGEQLKALAGICLLRTYRKGQLIFAEGDEGIGFYIVQSGQVRIFKLSPESGKEQILHILGPGESFGEVAVFTSMGFPAFAEAQASSVLIFFPRVAFVALIRRDPSLSLKMLAVLSRRLQKFARMIEDLSLKETPARLAAHLLYLCERRPGADEIRLDIPKGQMAALLGTIPETLSRIMARMGRQGLIRLRGNQISILDRTGLQEIASGERKLA